MQAQDLEPIPWFAELSLGIVLQNSMKNNT